MTLRLTLLVLALGLLTPLALGAVTPQGGSLDAGESLTINDVAVTEGNTGGVTASFTVTMTPASTATVTVDYATADGSATVAGGDYTAVPTTALTFAPGETSKTVDVTVNGDTLSEANETFNVDLTNASGGAVIADAQGVGTINDDDPQPSLSITDQTVTEGNAPATVNAGFTVSLSAASGQPVTVQAATANSSAIAPDDYTAVSPPTTLTFNPGETSKTVTVTVKGDALNEANETFHVDLSGATNATIADAQGVGTINDDDAVPSLSISDATVTEGDPPATVNATFNVNLSAASGQQVTVGYSTANNGGATAPADFTAKSGTLIFAAGETTKSIDVTVKGDLLDEPNETFFVNLFTPSNATISDPQGLGLINDDDPTPTLSINDVSVLEGNAGTVTATFTVNLSAASAQTVTVQAATADNSATVAGGDYAAIAPPTMLTFLPGETSKTVPVTVNGDLLNEINETFHVNLSAPSNATILDGQGVGTITDDDAQPTLAITDAPAVTEGNPPATVNASFTVGLSAPSGQVVTVHAATADQSAIAPGDYTAIAPAATVTFNPGETSKTVNVAVNGDLLNEPTETFVVNLANPTNATILDSQGVGTITDDDGLPTLAINDVSVLEGNAGTVGAVFTVNLSAASGLPVTVQAATADNSATVAGGDYVAIAPPTTLTFLPGETSKTVTVTVNGDGLPEANETFHVNLSGATNATIADAQGVGTITNDDPLPSLAISDATVTEGNPPATVNMTFTVTLSAVSGQTVSAQYATDDRTATVLADYQAANGTVAFAPGETSKTVTVVVNGDSLDEADETFVVDVVDATGATIADPQGQGTILDDDPPSTLAITNATVTEGNAPATVNATFTVGLSAASGQTVTVQAASANQSAIAPGDYTALAPPATVTFNPGETSKTVNVTVKGDALDEDDETFVVNLANATNATILDAQGVGTITDDDPPPTLAVNDVSVTETNAGTVAANFTVSLNTASGRGVVVGYATQDDSATSPADYTAASGTLNFAAGETSKQVAVTVNPDLLDEADETYFVNLSTPSNATIADGTGLGTIIDNDPLPAASINDVTVTEGDAGELEANFTVSLSAASGRGVTVDFTTANVTASTPADYQGTSGALFFSPGQTSRTITVNVHGDLLDEIDETFHVNLSGPTNATIADNQGVGTINDNDPPSSLSINDVTVTEGNAGSVNAVFTVTLAPASGKPVTVGYTTAGGTATTPGDYTAASGTLNFSAGEATKTITVAVVGDLLDEIDETFNVNLSGATNATIADAQGAGTITDDDPLPALSINDVTVTESDTGTVAATFNVSLGSPSGRTVSVNYSTADGSATAPADYAVTSGALTFAAGETTKTATVAVNGDLLDEVDENFLVNLAGAVDATIADGQGLGTVTDNDPLPSLSVNDVTVTEGNTGTVNATFTVTLAPVSGRQATVNYATANGTATAPADFVQKTGTLTFAAGETTKQVTVVVNGDALDEIDESLTLGLSGESNATILDGQGAGTITDDDPLPSLTVNDVAVTEGNAGTVAATFTLTLTPVSGRIVSVDYATANSTAATGDYQSGSGTVTFAPGETTKQVTVLVNGDTLDETDESFFLNLTNAPSATITDGQGIGTIIDDDGEPTLSVNDVTVTEGNSGTVNATFTASLSPASGQTVSVGYATADGSATAPADYVPSGNNLVFNPGQTSKTFTIQVNGDVLDEIDESFTVTLSNAVNAAIGDAQGLGTITDDDELPQLSVNNVTVTEGDAGTANATFTVSLNVPSGRALSVNYSTGDGTASAGADYVATSGTLNFAAGETSKTAAVPVNGDLLDEANETFVLNLATPTNATLADNQGVGTITDNDPPPALSINDVSVTEGNAGTVAATFTITLSAASGQTVTVDYATGNGTATAPADYAATNGTLTFAPGETAKQVTVLVAGDLVNEINETFHVDLSNAGNATIADAQGLGTITDDDGTPAMSVNDVTVSEGNAGTVAANFVVTLSSVSGQPVTVNYATANGTATAPADFAATSGPLTFAPGETTKQVTVLVNGDLLDEVDETFTVTLSSPTNATIADGLALGTITDDDALPALSISDVSAGEGDAGTTNATFTVSLNTPSGRALSVNYATANGTATAPADYQTTGGTLAFAAGDTSKTVTVPVSGDLLDENNETFFVNLSAATNAVISDDQGVATITDDDALPQLSVDDVTVTEGDSGTANATFTITLGPVSGRAVTVDYSTANGTAAAPADYNSTSGTLTFAAGETTKQVTVPVNGDVLDEADETFLLNLANPGNATIADGQGVGTITDDDPLPSLSINDVTLSEGSSGTVNATFTATLSAASGRNVTVDYATADGTAAAPGDYVTTGGSLVFAPGQTSRTLTVAVKGDVLDEIDETYLVNLTSPVAATIADGQGVGTIIDDDGTPALSINDVTVTEGQSGTVNANFAVTLSAASGQTVSVGFATSDGTATAGSDYVAGGGNLVFAPGQTTKTLTVSVTSDMLDELDETFNVNLSDPVNATIADGLGVGTILDDDPPPTASVNDVTVAEGDAGAVAATFTVSLNAASSRIVTVDYASADATATAPADYQAASGTVTFAAGQTSQQATVFVNGDLLDEINETFVVNLTSPTNATIGDGQGQGTITDDDPLPTVSIDDLTVAEGDAGTTAATFTVSLNAPSGRGLSVNYATADGTAAAPGDYAAASGTLNFAAGETAKTVTVLVNGDTLDEANETFRVNLSSPANATIADGQGVGTITDNDPPVAISVNDVTVIEGNSGTTPATFTVSLQQASGQTVTVAYATADGTAAAPGDYAALTGTLSFAAGETTKTVTVLVNGDALDEAHETYTLNLSNPTNATISDDVGLGTITNDDGQPALSVNDVTVTEGDSGTLNATFTVTLAPASGQTVSVNYATTDGTATAPADYTATSGPLTFTAGQTSRTVSVPIKGDTLDEANETFTLGLTTPVNATIADELGLGTITDNDPLPQLSVTDVTVAEGNFGTVAATFTVSLNGPSGRALSVDYATGDGTATAPADYLAASGTLNFAAGETSKQVTVLVNGDTLNEANDTFFLNLGNPTNAAIGDGQGVGTITDDDVLPTLSVNDVTVTEGNTGTVNATFTVTLSPDSGRTVTVDYATAGATATAPADYVATNGTLTFAAGETTKQVTVAVNGDVLDELDETFNLNLSNAPNATIGDGQGVGTITDDDAPPALSVSDVSVTEGNAGTVNAVFNVSLNAPSGRTVTVDYATGDGTATAPGDYASTSATLTFTAGQTSKTVTVLVKGDTLDEIDETYLFNLSNPNGATLADGQGTGTIIDDDATASLSIDDVTVTEGNSGTVNANFTVTLSAGSGQQVSVGFATADGTATAGSDYVGNGGNLVFNPGQVTKTLTIAVSSDMLDEIDETYTVGLSNPVNATIADGLGLGTILDDDPPPTVSVNDVTVTEGDTGTVAATFTASLNVPSGRAVSVDYATADGTATAGSDYAAEAGTLTFAAGQTSRTVTVPVNGDTLDEANETFLLDLSSPSNVTIVDAQGVGTITDNDPLPGLAVTDVAVAEGNSGTVAATFTLSLSAASGRAVSVDYATANGTATAPADYEAKSGTAIFAAGETTKTVTVLVKGDTLDESDETLLLNLTNAPNATITDAQGVGTITDDDPLPALTIDDVTVPEGTSGPVSATFTVSLSQVSGRTVTVGYATADNTATAPSDYVAATGTVTFAPGETTKPITVTVNGDTADEVNETYFVNLSAPGNATIADGQGVGTITDDDGQPTLNVNDVTVTEGDTGTTSATFTVTLAPASGLSVTVDYSTADGTATAPADYTSTPGSLVFTPGQTTRTITVPVNGDLLDETNETFVVNLANSANASIADGLGLGTITDNDPLPAVSVTDVTVTEGNFGTVVATFTVSLNAASGRALSVDYATADGTATAPADYTAIPTTTLTFAAGQTTKQVTVLVNGDTLDEANDTFFLNVMNPTNATILDGQGVGTITDDDAMPSLSVNDVTVAEGDTGTVAATFTLSLSTVSGRSVSVDYATANGSATAPGDYAAASGTATFAAGETTKQVTVLVNGDTLDESDETVLLNLTNPANASVSDAQGIATITDNDPTPTLAVTDANVAEGETGTVPAVFTVSLSAPSGRTVTVDYATADGTATAPGDYATTTGSLNFTPGQTSKTVTVLVKGDVLDEIDETYSLNLTNATNAGIADAVGIGTIIDDDGAPHISIADVTLTEGNSGTVNANFAVTLSAASGQTVSVGFATADGTATAGSDYVAQGGSLVFNPGQLSKTLTIPVTSDTLDELDETFTVSLSNPVNATILDGLALGTILDDDSAPTLSVNDVSIAESDTPAGDPGPDAASATFTVSLNNASGRAISVDYATADGTATAPGDYKLASGTLAFAAGQTTRTFTVQVNGDTLDEVNETFFVNLANATNATIADPQGVGTILDDDPAPNLSVNDVTVIEGDTGTVAANFTVSLSLASGKAVSFDYATANGTATAPGDYQAGSGTVTFAPGETTKTVTVLVNGDRLDEQSETLNLNLANAPNATITDSQGVVTITDDDPQPTVSIADTNVTEGDTGTVNATFTVSLSQASGQTVGVGWATADGTATAPSDYSSASGTVTFAPGETSKTLNVTVKGDTGDEPNETFFVNLSSPSNATIADAQGLGTIIDDDGEPQLSINDVSVTEGNSGTVNANFVVTLSPASGQQVNVGFATADGTATAGSDYVAQGGNLAFSPGQVSKQVTIAVTSDMFDELDETFTVNLSNPVNAAIGDAVGLGTIIDDDQPPNLSVNDVAVTEGDSGTAAATFNVSLNVASGKAISVDYATGNGTAIAPGDYQAGSGTLTFAAGETTKQVSVLVNGDTLDEANETFLVNLSSPSNAGIADGLGQGTITDDDLPPTVAINDVTVNEGDSGTVAATFNLSLSGPSGRSLSVAYATANGTATAPGDYSAASGTLSFAAGETTKQVTVLVNGDTLDEMDETFFVNLSAPVNVAIGDGQGAGTITDDDSESRLSIDDVAVTEGNTGTVEAKFTVSIEPASGQTVKVDYATTPGTATPPGDYQTKTGTLTFLPGEAAKQTVTVLVNGDLFNEENETYVVNLASAVNAKIADGQGIGTITDDDGMPTIAVSDATVTEGNSGTVPANFTITLDAPSGRSVTVQYATANDTAQAPSDYQAAGATLTFNPGQTSKPVTVLVNSDALFEATETFFVNLSSPVNATIADGQGIGTITNDDAQAPAPPPPPPPPPPPAPTPPPPPGPVRSANLLSPKNGAKVKSAPLFIWKPAKGARFYNLQIYFKGRQVFTGWPIKAKFKLRARWTYKGRKMRLRKGVYTWVVWPAYGRLGGNPRFGKMLGQSSFRYVGK